MKIQFFFLLFFLFFFFFFFGGVGLGGQGSCERRSEAFVKIHKKRRGEGLGVRVDVNREVKLL